MREKKKRLHLDSQERSILLQSLVEMKNCSMRERFVERLQIDGGNLCSWGEWFGRPYDNFHVVERVRWTKDKIQIHFEEEKSLYIRKPAKIMNEEKRLVIGDAAEILWVWYAYGKAHSYENMYVRQYTKHADGIIIRAEGKRSDVRNGDGILFHPLKEVAVYLG